MLLFAYLGYRITEYGKGDDIMANVLYVRANPKSEEHSNSSQLANFFISEYRKHNPDDTIDKLDLYTADIPFLDVDVFSAWGKFASNDELTAVEREKAERMDKLTNQFLEADKVIFAYPFWNLSLPPMLKAYIDTICINGKTFHYTEDGPEGLVPDKPFLLIETRGGFYSEGPAAELEHSQSYIQGVTRFIGIQNQHAVIAEGLDVDEATRNASLEKAREKLAELARNF